VDYFNPRAHVDEIFVDFGWEAYGSEKFVIFVGEI